MYVQFVTDLIFLFKTLIDLHFLWALEENHSQFYTLRYVVCQKDKYLIVTGEPFHIRPSWDRAELI